MRREVTVLFIIGLLLSLAIACGNHKTFDSAAWQKADARERGRMSQSLVKTRLLVGKSADETQRLLGRADSDFGSVLSYKIDLGYPFKDPKHYGLLIYLDSQRNVTEAKIVD